MQWEFVAALVLAIPVILFPIAFIWYINLGKTYHIIHQPRKKREKEFSESR